jgi:hypothetical protein
MAAVVLTSALLLGGIYPDTHWDYSTQMTKDNHQSVITDAISAGKTLFVRFIASEG